jgi:hypothetical protein
MFQGWGKGLKDADRMSASTQYLMQEQQQKRFGVLIRPQVGYFQVAIWGNKGWDKLGLKPLSRWEENGIL